MNQDIPFSQYMNNWLYDKDAYYSNYKTIGKEGDFFTSVSTSSFFGGSIAKKIIDEIEKNNLPKSTTIVEIGAHHGYLLADIIQFIYTLKPTLLESLNFVIVERFENLKEVQRKYLKECFADAINFKHYNNIEDLKLENAFIIANEIFDAFPCDLVFTENSELKQAFVKNNQISFKKCIDLDIINHCRKYNITKGEVCLEYKNFINTLCKNISHFHFLSFDYGDNFPRNDFSARIYSKHKVLPIFETNIRLENYFKNSDLTYDVFFTHLIDLFKNNKIEYIQYNTQMNTLIEFGIIKLLEILKDNSSENNYLRELQKVKMLIEPTGMGDRFKSLYIKK